MTSGRRLPVVAGPKGAAAVPDIVSRIASVSKLDAAHNGCDVMVISVIKYANFALDRRNYFMMHPP